MATEREVVQVESHTYPAMTEYVRLFNHTLSWCNNTAHGEIVASGDAFAHFEAARLLQFRPPILIDRLGT